MKVNLFELVTIQEAVNEKIREKLTRKIEVEEFILAFNVELFEYFNAIGTWKWWKHSHQINREKILDELADCFAFFLSAVVLKNEMALEDAKNSVIPGMEAELNNILKILEENLINEQKDAKTIVNDLILYVGSDNEFQPTLSIERFAISIFLAMLLFPGITWEEITAAYKKKSQVNIDRQVQGY
jgi:dimeric dUTPase (all-alpha-NTP-PPase superfamily)